jgi:hypothetical protein
VRAGFIIAFAWILAGRALGAQPGLPDLDVTHVERTPKYNPIPWVYPDQGPQFQGDPKTKQPYSPEQLKELRECPAAGDPVTFVAHVVNASDATCPAFHARWRIDRKTEPEVPSRALQPWEKTTFEFRWTWQEGPHEVHAAQLGRYRVYRVFAPQYHSIGFQPRYEKLADVPADVTEVDVAPPPGYAGVTDVPCFMVTAVDAQGRESGHADDRQLTRFAFPSGGATVERFGPRGGTVRVALGPQALVHFRESLLVEQGTRFGFRVRTTSRTPASLRFSVAGLGDVNVVLVGPPPADGAVLHEYRDLNTGSWQQIEVDLRKLLDGLAAERRVTPAEARTTWNEDWVVTAVRFGHFVPPAAGREAIEVYEFEDLDLAAGRSHGQ